MVQLATRRKGNLKHRKWGKGSRSGMYTPPPGSGLRLGRIGQTFLLLLSLRSVFCRSNFLKFTHAGDISRN